MKVMTVVGTRPELIRLSLVIPLLDKYCDHVLIHTGQNYDKNLKDIFFKDLNIREPNYTGSWWVGDRPSISKDINNILSFAEEVIEIEEPDKLLILGDTNSGLSSIIAKRYGIKVCHMEAGNRCFDDRVPEEVNRRIIDSCSDILMPYTERSRQNLIREGYDSKKIFVTGNPISEVIAKHVNNIYKSEICDKLNLDKYFLVTMHRAENVDNPHILSNLLKSLKWIGDEYTDHKIVISMHPHTLKRITADESISSKLLTTFKSSPQFVISEPFGFFDFVKLEHESACVISDSGTVQEECCILDIPSVTIRSTTERPETIECGSNILTGHDPSDILQSVKFAIESTSTVRPPSEYLRYNVSNTILKIMLGVT